MLFLASSARQHTPQRSREAAGPLKHSQGTVGRDGVEKGLVVQGISVCASRAGRQARSLPPLSLCGWLAASTFCAMLVGQLYIVQLHIHEYAGVGNVRDLHG